MSSAGVLQTAAAAPQAAQALPVAAPGTPPAASAAEAASPAAEPSIQGSNLFRTEALQAQQSHWLGTVRIGRPVGFAVFTASVLAVGAGLLAFATWGEVTRKARLSGFVTSQAGQLSLASLAQGTLLRMHVVEGAQVKAGQALAELATDRASAAGDTAALVATSLAERSSSLQQERQLRALQNTQRQDALAQRERGLQAELRHASSEAELLQSRHALAQKGADRQQQLANAGFVSDARVQSKQEELLELQARMRTQQRNASALEREVQATQAERHALATNLQQDLAQLSRAQSSLAQEQAENESRCVHVLRAPQAGQITALHAKVGQAVLPGQSLGTLVPLHLPTASQPQAATSLEIHLYAPSRTAGFVQPGQAVLLRYAAYPYQKFGLQQGWVQSISRTPINPQDLPQGSAQAIQSQAQSTEPLYRVAVRMDKTHITAYGEQVPLKPGMAVEADVLQDRRAIWEWVLEPVIAARTNLKGAT